MVFHEFLAKQEKIYAEFRDTSKIQAEGLIPQISDNKGGYIIALRHSENIMIGVEKFTEKISQVTSSIKYDRSNMHTTLATYQVVDGFSPVKEKLENLSSIVCNNSSLIKKVEIEYYECLMNQDSGIVGGIPNLAFFENASKIIGYAHEYGIELKFPWGAHATICRFLEKISPEQTQELLNIFKKSKPLGISKPNYIDVGHFILTPDSFKINVYERFEI
ncbi:MAG: hypothetical protein ACREV6_22480 [Clostridium sp.]|uniref:hypothetical protein n=1 Tax=Clostridium sp. TaxID=1506 RepID=UPI003D6CE970